MTGPVRFSFLSVEHSVEGPLDWNRPEWPKLWLYNLHYFDDLDAIDASTRRKWHEALVARWIVENPPGTGNGWEPYPTSLRIVNWIRWGLAGNELTPEMLQSLAVQARWLRKRLEFHLLGNHLWANAKALVFASAIFYGEEPLGWRGKGLGLLARELEEQILSDGGHFERSPMYHAIFLEDLLDLVQLESRVPGIVPASLLQTIKNTAHRMLRWLAVMSHPDGEISLFNDAAFGIASNYSGLLAYASDIGLEIPDWRLHSVEFLPDTGYVRLTSGPAILIADVGEVGPDYLPGHAHADTLSFELSIHGERVLVDTGTSTYETGSSRLAQRGTSAHNTVCVAGEDSSEVWSGFRVARRARPTGVKISEEGDRRRLEASHDGYVRLPSRNTHFRSWVLSPTSLRIVDRLSGKPVPAAAHFHLGVGMSELESSPGGIKCRFRQAGWLDFRFSTLDVEITDSQWHCWFGRPQPNRRFEVAVVRNGLKTEIAWREDSLSE